MNRQQFNAMVAQYGKQTVTSEYNVLEWNGGAHCHLPSLKFYGACSQNGTPTPDNPVDILEHSGVYQVTPSNEYIQPPILRSVGSNTESLGIIRDEWDYVTGKGIRRIKKLVLDGETNKVATATSKSGRIEVSELTAAKGNSGVMSTHFKSAWNTDHGSIYALRDSLIIISMNGSLSVDDWNAWLKAQYDAGTPVIIYYALKEPTPFEERVYPPSYKPIPNDSGRIVQDEGNLSGVPFEATYITHS